MLEQEMIDQLKSVFNKLENDVEISYFQSGHEKQAELLEMLSDLQKSSSKIKVIKLNDEKPVPSFFIKNISFTGIPGGHEFTSLVLAILNSDKKGKLPDEQIIKRIKNLKGSIHLKTYISLSCENCPEVVQALNLMTIFHSDFHHEMIDGEFLQEEVQRLGIQGVPSVMHGEILISAGKVNFIDLLKKIESHFGVHEEEKKDVDLGTYDVVVVGGGPAGASSAIYAARKGLKTLMIADKIGGQVQDTKGIENLISVPHTEGPQLAAKLTQHVSEYKIPILEHRRVSHVVEGKLKEIKLDSGEYLKTKSLIIATGAKWRELGIPGEKEYVGRGVAFCPHCDGPYYKGKDIAVVGGGNSGVEAAIDLAGIVNSVTLFEFAPELKADKVLVDKLKSLPNVTIKTNARTTQILGNGKKVVGLEYESRANLELSLIDIDGVFVQIGLVPNSQFIKSVVETNKFGEIIVDSKCRTNVKGIYAAGDVTTVPFKQIIIAMGEGAKAALTAFEEQMI
jgi:alkyl hydroperoxide reductase subunit F